MNFRFSDTTGKKSTTVTVFIVGFIFVLAKLMLSGHTIAGLTFEHFSGTEFGIALSALGGIYVLRRNQERLPPNE